LPQFRMIIELAAKEGPDALEQYGRLYNQQMQTVRGKCPRCGTSYAARPGQAVLGIRCTGCGAVLRVCLT
jgi:hypothetical protein